MLNPVVHSLENGLRIVVTERPYTPTVATRIYVRAGSCHDGGSGRAHLTEHMLFVESSSNGLQNNVFRAVESTGGQLQANTSREYATVSIVTTPKYFQQAFQRVAPLIVQPQFTALALAKEKPAVLSELQQAMNSSERIWDLVAETMWRHSPLRWPVLGTVEDLVNATLSDVYEFYEQHYAPQRTVISVAGNVSAEKVLSVCQEALGGWTNPKAASAGGGFSEELSSVRTRREKTQGGATRFVFAAAIPSAVEHDRPALRVLDHLLGAGRWSRLFSELKVRRGLVRSVSSLICLYEDCGYVACYGTAAMAPIDGIRKSIFDVWTSLYDQVTNEDVELARRAYIGSLARNFETNLAIASAYGIELLLNRLEPFRETIRKTMAVTAEEVMNLARKTLRNEAYVEVVCGPNVSDQNVV